MRRFRFGSALFASIIATIVMTAVMMYFGINIMRMLGKMAGMNNDFTIYAVGGGIHLLIGIIYGLIYALIFEPLFKRLPGFLSGMVYSFLPFILAITLMGKFETSLRSLFNNPKQPSMLPNAAVPHQDKPSEVYQNPPKPPSEQDVYQDENVPAPKAETKTMPQSPEPATTPPKKQNSTAFVAASNDVYSYSATPPKSAQSSSKMPQWLWSLINHLIYGFFLGLCYFPKKRFDDHHAE